MANFDQVTMGLAELLDAKKAEKIVLLDVSRQTILAETFVVCSGRSPAQLRMLADEAEQYMAKHGIFKKRMEGYRQGRWIVVDFGDLLVHLFHREEREFYDIERLWKDKDNFLEYEGLPEFRENGAGKNS